MSLRGERRKFLRAAVRAGADVRQGKNHQLVFVNGDLVTVIGTTGTAGRSNDLAASRRALRRAGLDL